MMVIMLIRKQAPAFHKLTNQSGMGETLRAPVHKGLKARTEASRVVPMPEKSKDQEFTKKRQKKRPGKLPGRFVLAFERLSRDPVRQYEP